MSLIGLVAALLPASCILPHTRRGGDHLRPASQVGSVPTVLPAVARDDSQVDPERHPLVPIITELAARPRPGLPYRGLDPLTAECLAARNSAVAQQLEAKRVSLLTESEHQPWLPATENDHANSVLAATLALEAAEVRNEMAGNAGQLFFRLAQAEAQAHLLRRSRAEVDAALEATRTQRERGLPVLEAYQKFQQQQIELRDREEELIRTIEQLNTQLKELLVLGSDCSGWSIWPVLNWDVIPLVPDPDAAIALGLSRRPQVLLLRFLSSEMDETLVPLVREILSTLNPLLAVEIAQCKLIVYQKTISDRLHHLEPAQLTSLRGRFERFRAWRERAIAEEIRQAVLDINSALRQLSIAQDRYRARKAEADRLQAKAGRGLTSSAELHAANLELLQAQSKWVDQVIAWNLARVRLEQAQGALAARCGCAPASPACPLASGSPSAPPGALHSR